MTITLALESCGDDKEEREEGRAVKYPIGIWL